VSARSATPRRLVAPSFRVLPRLPRLHGRRWCTGAARPHEGMADSLATVALAMVERGDGVTSDDDLRLALRWAVVPANQGEEPPAELKTAYDWLSTSSLPVADLPKPEVFREVRYRLSFRLDGVPAAGDTFRRRRRALNITLEYAVDTGVLLENPLQRPACTARVHGRGKPARPGERRTGTAVAHRSFHMSVRGTGAVGGAWWHSSRCCTTPVSGSLRRSDCGWLTATCQRQGGARSRCGRHAPSPSRTFHGSPPRKPFTEVQYQCTLRSEVFLDAIREIADRINRVMPCEFHHFRDGGEWHVEPSQQRHEARVGHLVRRVLSVTGVLVDPGQATAARISRRAASLRWKP
jgi:hypothetical protein